MSIKEVADAYIEIHGDLSPFRRDLQKAAARFKKDGEEAGQAYVDGMTDRADKEFGRKWGKLLDTIYSGDKLDWDKLFGEFDSENFERAGDAIDDFLGQVREAGLIDTSTWIELSDKVDQNTRAFEEAANFQDIFKREVEEARLEADRFARSLDGLRESATFDDMERSLKGIAEATKGLDIGPTMDANYAKMVKAAGGYEQFATQIDKTMKVSLELGRVTEEQADAIVRSVDRYIDAEKRREITLLASKDAAKEAAKAMTDFEKSFEAREMRQSLAAINKDMDALARSVKTNNWSEFAKGHKTIDSMRDRLKDLTSHFRGTAEMSEESARRIEASFNRMAANPKKFGVELEQTARKFRPIHFAMEKLHTSWVRMDSTVRLVLGLIASAAGPMATLGSGLAGSLTAIVSSLANAAGAIVPLGAAAAGFGVAIGLAVSAWDNMIATTPQLTTALNNVSSTWQEQANAFGTAWGETLAVLLDNFATQLGSYDFGVAFGNAFQGITRAFNDVVMGPAFGAFMTAMTGDIPAAVQGLGTGFANMMNVLLGMLAAAAPTAKALGDDFARWSEGLSNALTSSEGMSQMSDTFARMRESLLVVLDLAGSLGMALGTMFSLGADSGDRLLTSLTGVVDQFTAWMNTDAGREAMIQWFERAEQIIYSLEPVLVAVGQAIAGLVTPESIAQFENLMVEVGAFVDVLGEVLSVVSQMGLLNILFAGLNAIGAAITPLLPALGQVATIIGQTLVGAIHALTPLFAAIGGAIAPFIAGMAQIWTVVGPAVVDAFGRITTALTPVFEVLGQLVAFIMGVVAPILGPFIVGIINSLVGVIEGLSNVFMGVVTVITAIITGFATFFQKIFQGDIPGAMAGLGAMFSGIWNGAIQIISGAVQAIWELINLWIVGKLVGGVRSALSAIGGVFRTGWQGISSFFSGIIKSISDAGTSGMTGLRTGVTNAVKAIQSFFSSAWKSIQSTFTSVVKSIQSTGQSVFAAIQNFISSSVRNVQTTFTAGWRAIQNVASTVVNAISQAIRSGFQAASNFVSSSVASIRNFVSSGFAAVRNAVSSAMSALGNAVSSGISRAVGFFSALGSRITGAVGNLAGVGRAIIQGLIGGITAMAGAVIEAATGVVSGAIEAAKGLLNLGSPSKLFRQFGVWTGEGFVEGLDDETKPVKTAAERMIDAVTAPFEGKSLNSIGKLAATSLADGFASKRAVLDHAMEFASAPAPQGRRGVDVESTRTVGGTTVILEKGAVQTTTNVADPELVAESTMDNLVAVASRM